MVTEKQLRARARRVQDAEERLRQTQASRDALVAQAAQEHRFTQTQIADFIGLGKMAVTKIVRKVAEENGREHA